MTSVARIVATGLLGASVCGLLPACSGVAHPPLYTDAELQAACEREGGWWRGNLIPRYCESQSTALP